MKQLLFRPYHMKTELILETTQDEDQGKKNGK